MIWICGFTDRRVSKVDTAADPEAAARVARVARRFFGAELPSVVGAQEPVLIARPDQADADALEVAVVLHTRIDAAVLIDPDTAVLEVRGEVQLLVLGAERQEPAQLCTRQIARIARSFARRVSAYAVRAAEGEVLRGVEVGQLPATEVASLRESYDTSICLDRPGLLHSQSCEVQQRSGNYQSH